MNKIFHTLLTESGIKPASILHVGANRGQEAKLYNSLSIEGWHVEAIPAVYEEFLLPACKNFPDQHAINACLSSAEGNIVKFNIANNQGQSSSFLDLGRHALAYPFVKYVDEIELVTKTIDTLIRDNTIPSSIEFLLIDAQGAEALILDGAKSLLASNSLLACQIETAVVPLYDGGATFVDICQRLSSFGLYLRHCVFNEKGWTDALFMRSWWPQEMLLETGPTQPKIIKDNPKPRIEYTGLNKVKPESNYLVKYQKKVYSQWGEEGIIEQCFKIMGEKNRWCVEFGAWDGINLSNTYYFVKKNWSAVHIEGNAKRFEKLKQNFSGIESTIQINKIVGYSAGENTLDDILKNTNIPIDFDFASIDIDGNDWYVWESLNLYRPRLIVIEFNPTVPNDIIFVQPRDITINQGCSLAALIELSKKKRYQLICVHGANAYFVVEEEFDKFNISDNSIDAMRVDTRGRIWCGFDGTIFNTLGHLNWAGRGRYIDPLDFQILPSALRKYGDRIIHE